MLAPPSRASAKGRDGNVPFLTINNPCENALYTLTLQFVNRQIPQPRHGRRATQGIAHKYFIRNGLVAYRCRGEKQDYQYTVLRYQELMPIPICHNMERTAPPGRPANRANAAPSGPGPVSQHTSHGGEAPPPPTRKGPRQLDSPDFSGKTHAAPEGFLDPGRPRVAIADDGPLA